jgi:hypothetical protein
MLKHLKNLCTPASLYFVLSALSLLIEVLQNWGNSGQFCLGSFACNVESTLAILLVQTVFIVFWTWVLDLICKSGNKNIAWFLVLLPYILMFVGLGIFMLNQGVSYI